MSLNASSGLCARQISYRISIVGMQLAALTLPEDGAMKCPDDQMIENIDRLSVAIEQRRQVTYSDKDHMDGLARRMRISPYALLWLKKGCCVLCNQEGQSGLSCLELANMSSIRTDMTPWRNYSEISRYRELDLEDIAARLEAGRWAEPLVDNRSMPRGWRRAKTYASRSEYNIIN